MRFSTGIVAAVLAALVGTTPARAQTAFRIGPSVTAIAGAVRGTNSAYDYKNGQYLVVAAYGGLNGVFVTADGVVGAQFGIPTGDFAHYPGVAYSPDLFGGGGGFLVTWHQSFGQGALVHGRFVSATGVLGPEIVAPGCAICAISSGGSWWEAAADVAYSTTSKEFLVVWQGAGITAQRIDLNGQLIGGNFQVTPAGAYGRDPAVVYNPTTNQFLVSFGSEDGASPFAAFQRVAAGSGALVGPEGIVGRARGVYITEAAYNSVTNQYLVSWYQGGTYGVLVDANGNVVTNVTLLSLAVTAYDALGIDYNATSGTFMMVSHTQSPQDGAVEINGVNLASDVPIIATGVPTTLGNYYPKISSRVGKAEWLLTTATGFGATTVQRLGTTATSGPTPVAVSLRTDKAFPVQEGTAVTFTAASTGGKAPVAYQFWRYTAGVGWSMVQDYSSVNTYAWAPVAGTHAVQVYARSSGSSAAYDAYAETGLFGVTAPTAKLTSLVSNVTFPSAPNVPITFTAQATGGPSIQYQFWRFTQGSGWAMVQDYGPINTFTWYPTQGTYAIQVWARLTGSSASYEDYRSSGVFTVASSPARLSSLTVNRTFPSSPSAPITWTAVGAGGNGPLEYRFWVYGTSGWTVAQDWSANNQMTWTPGVPNTGQHVVQVWVRTQGSGVAYEDWRATDWFLITDSTSVALTASLNLGNYSVGNGCVLFTANTSGPGVWEYSFWTYSNSTWSVSQTYSSVYNNFNYCPTAGTHAVQVWTRQAGSTGSWERWASTGFFVVNP